MTPSPPSPSTRLPPARYPFGGDEHLFVEISQEMSLQAFFKGLAVTTALTQRRIAGVTEICPANASYLVRFDPDQIAPNRLLDVLEDIEATADAADMVLDTRIIELPVLYADPWTHKSLMRFPHPHQNPT